MRSLNWRLLLVLLGVVAFWFLVFSAIVHAEEIDLNKIAMIESSGNPLAWNKKDDSRGTFQITPICLKEFNNFHPNTQYTMDDLWDEAINREIADWYLNVRIPQMLRYYKIEDTTKNRIFAYNAGIKAVIDNRVPEITKAYFKKYGVKE